MADLPSMFSAAMGIPVVRSSMIPSWEHRQVRFPRSKRKRIRKKWRKNRANWGRVLLPPVMYQFGGQFIVNEAGWRLAMGVIHG